MRKKRVYYVGGWAAQIGPVYAETSPPILWKQYARLWSNAARWLAQGR